MDELMIMFIMLMGAIGVGGFSFILLILLATMTPAMSFFSAKLKKRPILAVRRSDRKIDYIKADKFIQPLAISDKYGGFIVDPDAVYSAQRGGVSILPVNSEIGVVLSEKVLGIMDALKKANIDNYDEAEWLADNWRECECGYTGVMIKNDKGEFICPKLIEEVENYGKTERKQEQKEEKTETSELPRPPSPPEPARELYVSAKDRAAQAGTQEQGSIVTDFSPSDNV